MKAIEYQGLRHIAECILNLRYKELNILAEVLQTEQERWFDRKVNMMEAIVSAAENIVDDYNESK